MRPQIHFTPNQNWINDPNGLIYFNSEYHLFYQHNPQGNKWGHMSWGHAKSRDLLSWQELPVAIKEQPDFAIFSGSAVHDEENRRLVAIFTAHRENNQSQHLAFSYDGGTTWKLFENNPVLDIGYVDFRDPKVMRYQNLWLMSVAKPWEEKVSFFSSSDLMNWKHLSDFETECKEDIQWECPDLFELDGKWVLLVSENKPNSVGKCKMRYYIGEFDGKEFIPDEHKSMPLDYGPDFYAGVTFNDAPDSQRIIIGWMNNWSYAQKEKFSKQEIWNGSMSVARKLSIENKKLVQYFLAPTKSFQIPSDVEHFALRYKNGDLKFHRRDGWVAIFRGELWDDELLESAIPTPEGVPLSLDCVFDAGSIEIRLNGLTYSARLNVGPEVPELVFND